MIHWIKLGIRDQEIEIWGLGIKTGKWELRLGTWIGDWEWELGIKMGDRE